METSVSIIIPVYNRYQILGETLDCLLSQSFHNWECLLVDDGSEDYSKELCDFYISKDKRFKLYNNKKKGAASARNLGLDNATGDFIQFLDSDDLICNEKIKNQVEFLDEFQEFDLVTCPWGRFYNSLKKAEVYQNLSSYKNFDSLDEFLKALSNSFGFFPVHSYLFRKKLIERSGQWNEILTLNDDSEFVVRQLINTKKIGYTPNGKVYYRFSEELSLSKYNKLHKIENAILAWRIIALRLRLIFGYEHFFITKEKKQIYLKLKNTYPQLINDNQDFFVKQIQEDCRRISLAFRFRRKINHIFKRD